MRVWLWTGSATLTAAAAAAIAASPMPAEPVIGAPAPGFTATDMNGKPVRLSDYRGKPVVIEWNNPGCPFVQKHYKSGNMQRSQAAAKSLGASWLTVNSGAPGKQGYMDGAQARAFVASEKASPTAYLLDPGGAIGHAYGAKTTPHMYVVDASGKLVYAGGIDDIPSTDQADIAKAHNYVLAALRDLKAGKPVAVPESRPYGCSVKYGA